MSERRKCLAYPLRGQKGERVYNLAEGSAEVYAGGRIVRELAIGESFGTIMAVSQRSILETVRGRTALELCVLARDDFTQVMAADRGSRLHLLLMASQTSCEQWPSMRAESALRSLDRFKRPPARSRTRSPPIPASAACV